MALEDSVSLDISDALASIDRLGAGLTQVAQQLGVELAASLDNLREPVPVTADASAIPPEIEQALAAADTQVEPTADASAIGVEVTAAVAGADATVVPDAETAGLESSITLAVSDADAVVVPEADTTAVVEQVEAAVAAADGVVPVEADTEGVPAAIEEAVAASDTRVQVDADVASLQGEIEAAVSGATATLDVQANTEEAQESLADLGLAAQESAGGIGGADAAMGSLGIAATLASGNVGGLKTGFGQLIPGSTAAGVAVAGVGAIMGTFVSAATGARESADTFRIVVGDMADEVNTIDIGGLNTSLEDLAVTLGQDDEAAQNAAARIFQLGEAAGVARPQVADTTKEIAALAARAIALNPALGDLGTVAEGMLGALARGGRPAAQLGLDLNSAEIEARAFKDRLVESEAPLSIFEKAAAGAAISVERLGDQVGADIQQRVGTTTTGFAALRQELGNVTETAGQPLLDPLLAAMREGQPTLLALGEGLGMLAEALLPIAVDLLPLASGSLRTLGVAVEVAAPILDVLADILNSIPAPLLEAAGMALVFNKALGPLTGVIRGLVSSIGSATVGGGLASALIGLNPVMLAGGLALTGLTLAISSHSRAREEEKARVDAASGALEDNTEAVGQNTRALLENVLAERNQIDDLRRLGLTFDEFTDLVLAGTVGLTAFLDTALRAGDIKVIDDTTRQTFDSVGEMVEQYGSLDEAMHNVIITGNEGLVNSFRQQQGAVQDAAAEIIDAALAAEDFTQAEVDAAYAATLFGDETRNSAGALNLLRGGAEGAAEAAEGLTGAGEKATGVLGTMGDKADDGAAAMLRMRSAMDELLGSFVGAEQAGISYLRAQDRLQESTVKVWEAQSVLDEAIRAHGVDSVEAAAATEELSDAQLGLREANLGAFTSANDLTVAMEKQTGALKGAGPEAKALRDQLVAMRDRFPELRQEIDKYVGRIDAMAVPDLKMDEAVIAAREALNEMANTLGPITEEQARRVGKVFGQGLANGINSESERLRVAGALAGERVTQAARQSFGMRSPSRVGIEIGENFTEAIAAGIAASQAVAVAEAERLASRISDSAAVFATAPLTAAQPMWGPSAAVAAPSSGVGQPLVTIAHADFSDPVDVDVFGQRLAFQMSVPR